MCRAPCGAILPPQSMSLRDGPIVTEYLKASALAFGNNVQEYTEQIKKTNFTKNGSMRSTMSTPIAGSCRLIAAPMWGLPRNLIGISKNLASRLRVCKLAVSDGNIRDVTYTEATVKEGDWCIVIRPPSLSVQNFQPMRYVFWEHDCAGIHPEAFAGFHGDFDGDELHTMPVFSPESVRECEAWEVPPLRDFTIGRELLARSVAEETPVPGDDNRCEFIEYSTVSACEMYNEVPQLLLGAVSRSKPQYIAGMHRRFRDASTEDNYVVESIRGMDDVCRQQLSQGALGDMTRVAKCVAMCFFRPPSGGLYVACPGGSRRLVDDGASDAGCPAERAVMALCAAAQQAALDSHRVGESVNVSFDFISDLFMGKPIGQDDAYNDRTLVVFDKAVTDARVTKPWTWSYETQDTVVTLSLVDEVDASHVPFIEACYNTKIMSMCSECGVDIHKVCRRAIVIVANYYEVKASKMEVSDLAVAMCYEARNNEHQITTRKGAAKRPLAWVDKLLSTDYTKAARVKGSVCLPQTSTSAMFMNNFELLKTRECSEHYVRSCNDRF